jgi:hypothetical protein
MAPETPAAARPGRDGQPPRYRKRRRGFKPDYLSFAGTYLCNHFWARHSVLAS